MILIKSMLERNTFQYINHASNSIRNIEHKSIQSACYLQQLIGFLYQYCIKSLQFTTSLCSSNHFDSDIKYKLRIPSKLHCSLSFKPHETIELNQPVCSNLNSMTLTSHHMERLN